MIVEYAECFTLKEGLANAKSRGVQQMASPLTYLLKIARAFDTCTYTTRKVTTNRSCSKSKHACTFGLLPNCPIVRVADA